MDEHSKKVLFKILTYFCVIFIVSFVIMTIFMAKELGVVAAFSKPVDIRHEALENFDNIEAVDTTLQMAFGRFGSEVTEIRNRGTHGSAAYVDYYYAVAVENEGKRYYVAVKMADEDSSPYNKLTMITYQYMQGDNDILGTYTKSLEGSFTKMDDATYQELKDWLWEKGIVTNEKELDTYVLPYIIKEADLEVNRQLGYALSAICAIGIFVLILGVISRNKRYKSSKK